MVLLLFPSFDRFVSLVQITYFLIGFIVVIRLLFFIPIPSEMSRGKYTYRSTSFTYWHLLYWHWMDVVLIGMVLWPLFVIILWCANRPRLGTTLNNRWHHRTLLSTS
ncbi:MAG: hypothetical protein RIQ54_564 [Candidatus Parcubacteria bacterium]|jgi:hypothetical protein